MNNYIQDAQRTTPPITPDLVTRVINLNTLSALSSEITRVIETGAAIDNLKKHLFYGRPLLECDEEEPISNSTNIRSRLLNERNIKLLHASLGLITEAAEFAEAVISHIYGGRPLDDTNIIEELGDNQWYSAEACAAIDTNLEIVQAVNIRKLKRRYPEKFTEDAALSRDLEAERSEIETISKRETINET